MKILPSRRRAVGVHKPHLRRSKGRWEARQSDSFGYGHSMGAAFDRMFSSKLPSGGRRRYG